ncbi:MAG: hypothetical protein ACFB0E_08640 [Leptolyngbyaceae cyanobacterium]
MFKNTGTNLTGRDRGTWVNAMNGSEFRMDVNDTTYLLWSVGKFFH